MGRRGQAWVAGGPFHHPLAHGLMTPVSEGTEPGTLASDTKPMMPSLRPCRRVGRRAQPWTPRGAT